MPAVLRQRDVEHLPAPAGELLLVAPIGRRGPEMCVPGGFRDEPEATSVLVPSAAPEAWPVHPCTVGQRVDHTHLAAVRAHRGYEARLEIPARREQECRAP